MPFVYFSPHYFRKRHLIIALSPFHRHSLIGHSRKGYLVKIGNALCISTLLVVPELNSGSIDKVYSSHPKRLRKNLASGFGG